MMDFKEGEVLFFNKPLGWTSFKVVGHARYHICRRIKVKKLKWGMQVRSILSLRE